MGFEKWALASEQPVTSRTRELGETWAEEGTEAPLPVEETMTGLEEVRLGVGADSRMLLTLATSMGSKPETESS